MEEIKKKNKKLKKVAIILFIVIILLGALDGFLYFKMYPIIDYAMMLPSKTEIQMFNAIFIERCGKIKGSEVKDLLQSIMGNNIIYGDENKKRKVLISFITAESIITGGLLLVLIGIIKGEIYYIF